MHIFGLVFTLAVSVWAWAQDKKNFNPPIKAGTAITVVSYQEPLDTFVVKINSEPAIGPNVAYSKDLFQALQHEGSLKDFMKNRGKLIGAEFTLKKPLPMADMKELAQKLKAKSAKK